MARNIDGIIRESIRKTLVEMDIVPTDDKGETNLILNQAINAWRMIYRLMDNVKTVMDADWDGKQGNISKADVNNIINYIQDSLQGITRNTINIKKQNNK